MARIELELQARGYNVIILCNNRSLTTEKELAALAVSYSVSGVLLFPQDSVGTADGNSSAVQLLQANHIPVVIVDRAIQQHDIDCVRVDDEGGGYLAGKTLAQLGVTRSICIWPDLRIILRSRSGKRDFCAPSMTWSARVRKASGSLRAPSAVRRFTKGRFSAS